MCNKPVLQQPDFTKPFIILMDTSAYGMGAILLQEGEIDPQKPTKKPKLHPVAYYSATFTVTERGYDIYERELLAIIKAITHWRPYLIWTEEPFTIRTDHANLLYWKSPRKLNRCMARWHMELQDYHFVLEHVPGKTHTTANALSRPPSADEGKEDNQDMTMIPEHAFIRVFDTDSPRLLEHQITEVQAEHASLMKQWEETFPIETIQMPMGPFWKDSKGCLVIPPDGDLKWDIMCEWHDGPLARHLGRDETTCCINKSYFWLGAQTWVD